MEKLSRKKLLGMKIGFTTVELLVYITIITVVTTVLTNFVIDATKTAAAARQARAVQQNTRVVMSKIMREVRQSSSYVILSSGEELQMVTSGQTTGFYLDNGTVYYYVGSKPVTPVASEAISNGDITVSSLNFIQLDNTVSVTVSAEPTNPLLGSGSVYSLTSAFTPRQYVY